MLSGGGLVVVCPCLLLSSVEEEVSSNSEEGNGAGAAQSPESESVGFLLTLVVDVFSVAFVFALGVRFADDGPKCSLAELTISSQSMSSGVLVGVAGMGVCCCWLLR